MKENVFLHNFRKRFIDYGRKHHFSYDAIEALYRDLIETEASTGCEYTLDILELCDEYSEYENMRDFLIDYPDLHPDTCIHCGEGVLITQYTCPDCEQSVYDHDDMISRIEEQTIVITVDKNRFIIKNF